MALATTLSKLLAIVTAIKNTTPKIGDIYDEIPTNLDTTPAVAIFLENNPEESSSSGSNLSTENWTIRVMVEKTDTSGATESTQTALLYSLIDKIKAELRKDSNRTLDCTAHDMMPVDVSQIAIAQAGDVTVYFMDISVKVKIFESVL